LLKLEKNQKDHRQKTDLMAFFSVKESGKPPDDKHRHGHGKIERVADAIQAMLIFATAA
jgi:divalent metal cation (Fe/Co/Zn/Cd) transporter